MNVINILPENIVNKIAAGEVIERPSAVVKELIENSIDADSSNIYITLMAGGKKLISVFDNGKGMSRDDILLAFERHATSKISTEEDLNNINTLGFRGEALSSIAAVSRLSINSCTKTDECANCLEIEGGKIKKVREVAAPCGTSVEVKDLFFNVPARLKFLKSTTTELSHIVDYITTQALALPNTSFCVYHNSKKILLAERVNNLQTRIASLFGHEILNELIPVDYEEDWFKIKGFISKPACTRAKRIHQYWYVNKRNIRNHLITHALYQSYEGLLMKERHPLFILFIDVPPILIDVNVHPAKSEVRFVEATRVYEYIKSAIKKALQQVDILKATKIINRDLPWIKKTPLDYTDNIYTERENPKAENIKEAMAQYLKVNRAHEEQVMKRNFYDKEPTTKNSLPRIENRDQNKDEQLEISLDKKGLDLTPIGQFKNTFILLQSKDELVIMDQHAAHERVMYEKIKNSMKKHALLGQNLLIPYNLELSPKETVIMKKHIPLLSELCFEIEHFGQNTFIIKSIPASLNQVNIKEVLSDIINELNSFEKTRALDDVCDPLIKRLACHSAIKANQSLDITEIKNLLEQWQNTELPYTCPHGRPILVRYELSKLRKDFERT